MKFSWDKGRSVECCTREETRGIVWVLAGVWRVKGIRKKAGKGKGPLVVRRRDCQTHITELFKN
jgi:hypothetical protein